ncbi:MAG: endonuclease/exonuclease/phosphatase family protein [Rhodobacteraceae bacterium]|nr:endonuclease/exonuclease/phosphatase family protein [Paracoccaceae bacterium]
MSGPQTTSGGLGWRGAGALLVAVTLVGPAAAQTDLRVASYNAALTRDATGALVADLRGGDDPQARALAEVIQSVRPDVLLVNELDWDAGGEAADLFRRLYLAVGQNGQDGIDYPHVMAPPVNTGVASGVDLDGDGDAGGPGDAWGFGRFPGQYGFAVFSRLPFDNAAARTFQTLPWRAMPATLLDAPDPEGAPLAGPGGFYAAEVAEILRLSSKSHLDLPLVVGDLRVHLLAAHPTPPVFDGLEDRNGKRNHDEIRFWADYIEGAAWITDDAGQSGGLPEGRRFVIFGDLNADPFDGDSRGAGVRQLLDHPKVLGSATDPEITPAGEGSLDQPDETETHAGDPRFDTADFGRRPGNLRVDYVLPSRTGFRWMGGGVVWPRDGAPLAEAAKASDHRLVWVDLRLVPLD